MISILDDFISRLCYFSIIPFFDDFIHRIYSFCQTDLDRLALLTDDSTDQVSRDEVMLFGEFEKLKKHVSRRVIIAVLCVQFVAIGHLPSEISWRLREFLHKCVPFGFRRQCEFESRPGWI